MDLEKAIIDEVAKDARVKLVALFGSVAQGQAEPESDLDVAIAADRPLTAQEQQLWIESVDRQLIAEKI